MYVAPPVILVIVSFTSFLLDDNVEARIIIITGVLTQLIMQWAAIYNKLPPVSVLTQLDVWMLTNLAFVGIVLIVNAVICHFVIKEKEEKEEMKERKTKKEKIKTKTKVHKSSDNALEGSKSEIQASSQQVGQTDERTRLLDSKQPTYHSTENSTDQAIGKKPNCVETPCQLLSEKKGLEEDFHEFLEDNEEITTSTKWEDAKNILKEDPRFERARIIDMASTWYQTYLDKKKKENFQCLLKEKLKTFTMKWFSKWERVKWKIDHDPRYAVVDVAKRKQWFNEYQRSQILTYINAICFVGIAVLYFSFVGIFWKMWAKNNKE
ncbi:ligand-gated ion channel 50-like [Mercenaria mercenaria]|uniref:ligand-gated ion channel 50-like n=1 Tax=Mercenaria mercenaria TaxID=6596 RepID=UPI00234F0DFB|nr:ligand-gated ion channel 50-like [Mercenaria mercenaria]